MANLRSPPAVSGRDRRLTAGGERWRAFRRLESANSPNALISPQVQL